MPRTPQALRAVLSRRLYATVRRWSVPAAGLIAARGLALTPGASLNVPVQTTTNALLVLLLIVAAYCCGAN